MARVIVGTAGHIDHGKSTLVRALTGTDPDRLPEEKKRGITIDLGYAFFGDVAAIIDVPGHEKLIRNMVAGAATIDFALLVIAADDGVMPQTTEHLQILRLLGVQRGAIVLTKCDAVEAEWLDLVEDQVRTAVQATFLESSPIFRVDSLSGRGIDDLRERLTQMLVALPARSAHGVFRLPIDRIFVIKGRGSVVTGTILSGSIQKDTRLAVLPGGFDVRVKRLETQGAEAEQLHAGQRAALNLMGDTDSLERGRTLTIPGALLSSPRVKVAIELIASVEPLKDRQRVRFLVGTQEVIGRVQILERPDPALLYANLLLEEETVAVWGDHFVLRRYSPLETLGGGRVLEPAAARLRARDLADEIAFARALNTPSVHDALFAFLRYRARAGIPVSALAASFGTTAADVLRLCAKIPNAKAIQIGEFLILDSRVKELQSEVQARLSALHRKSPESRGFSRAEVKSGNLGDLPDTILDHVMQSMIAEGSVVQEGPLLREPERRILLTPAQQELNSLVLSELRKAAFAPPSSTVIAETLRRTRPEVEKSLVLLERLGHCRRLGLDLFFETQSFDNAVEIVRAALQSSPELTVAEASRLLTSSRKYVVPFLEYLDNKGITQREGNVRIRGRSFA
ncbi:MAG TPA: selenocysteine-specific translation elongation factor [bacterium]|jgi:selenocysteine-specific elongation factor